MSFPIQTKRNLGMATMAALMLFSIVACNTESANRTATVAASGTPATTITPAGTILTIDGDAVQNVYVPDLRQSPLYALTDKRLYIWRNRKWEATPTVNDNRAFLVDHNDPERLFRGDHPPCDQPATGADIALEMSEDGGETWQTLPNGQNIRPMAIDPIFPNVVYGTDCALTISNNLGDSWRYFQPLFEHEIVDLAVVGERMLVLGISDSGKSQVRELRLSSPDQPEISDIIVQIEGIACVAADADRIIVGSPNGVHISLNGGQTWVESRVGLESVTIPPDDNLVAPNNPSSAAEREFGVLTVAIDPSRSHRIFAGTVRGLYISQDDGGTWDRYDEIASDTQVRDIQFAANGADLYVTTSDGVVTVPNP
jgi:photosystem II stability/assembly factor-like uncharacterized protein